MLVLLAAGCGNIEPDDSLALMRGTDVATDVMADAGSVGGAAGASVDSGAGGAAGAPGTGGMVTSTGGATGSGGVTGSGGAPDYTCADLVACCSSLPAGPLKQQCLTLYNGGNTAGYTCGGILAMIKAGGTCD